MFCLGVERWKDGTALCHTSPFSWFDAMPCDAVLLFGGCWRLQRFDCFWLRAGHQGMFGDFPDVFACCTVKFLVYYIVSCLLMQVPALPQLLVKLGSSGVARCESSSDSGSECDDEDWALQNLGAATEGCTYLSVFFIFFILHLTFPSKCGARSWRECCFFCLTHSESFSGGGNVADPTFAGSAFSLCQFEMHTNIKICWLFLWVRWLHCNHWTGHTCQRHWTRTWLTSFVLFFFSCLAFSQSVNPQSS